MITHYETLGVVRTATTQEITTNYRKIARVCHPDKTLHLPPAEQKRQESYFKQVLEAYEILRDKDKRRQYDRNLPPVSSSPPPPTPSSTWSQTWAPDPKCHLAEEPDDVNPSLEEEMGYKATINDNQWSYTIRFSKRFDIASVARSDDCSPVILQDGYPFELHLRINLDVRDVDPDQTEEIEDMYIAIHKSPAVCTAMHTYFQHNRYEDSFLHVVIAAAGEPSTPQCRPGPWEFPVYFDMGGFVPSAYLDQAHVIGTYTTFSNDQFGPPTTFGGADLIGSKRLKLDKSLRKESLKCGEKVFTKRTAVCFK